MTNPVQPIPQDHPRMFAYLTLRGADKALAFYRQIFNAEETLRLGMPDGSIGHAEFKIGDSDFMLSEENPNWKNLSPETLGGSPVSFYLYVEDVDATFAEAIAAGAKAKMPVMDQFWGDRSGQFIDPFGHHWHIASHSEEVDPASLHERMLQAMSQRSAC